MPSEPLGSQQLILKGSDGQDVSRNSHNLSTFLGHGKAESGQNPNITLSDATLGREVILTILQEAKPDVVYTHNPFDKHATHIGVMLATLAAIHELPEEAKPKKLFFRDVPKNV